MDLKNKIKSLIQEGELYQRQGLNNEAVGKFRDVEALLRKHQQIKNVDALLSGIAKKIQALDNVIEKKRNEPAFMEMSQTAQNVVRDILSQAHGLDEEHAALEGAITLVKFGQFKRALEEFEALIRKDALRVVVAKNMLRCHMSLSSEEEAIHQYEQWVLSDFFQANELEKVRMFLEGLLRSKGIDRALAKTADELRAAPAEGAGLLTPEELAVTDEIELPGEITLSEEAVEAAGRGEAVTPPSRPSIEMPKGIEMPDVEDEVLDVSSVGIEIDEGPRTGQLIEIDVNFQSDDRLTIIVPKDETDLVGMLKIGRAIENIQFYSAIAMFGGTGTITSNKVIDSGPKKGDFSVDIKITSR